MVPIFEQGSGSGIGHGVESFIERFDQICVQHLKSKRAASFAFVFYDFHDRTTKKIMKDMGVFAQLDRLTGSKMSLFYLHTSSREGAEAFNTHFLQRLGIEEATLPCVAFFNFKDGEIENLEVACLDNANLIHGFHELYGVVEQRVQRKPPQKAIRTAALRWLKGGSKEVAVEALKDVIAEGLVHIF